MDWLRRHPGWVANAALATLAPMVPLLFLGIVLRDTGHGPLSAACIAADCLLVALGSGLWGTAHALVSERPEVPLLKNGGMALVGLGMSLLFFCLPPKGPDVPPAGAVAMVLLFAGLACAFTGIVLERRTRVRNDGGPDADEGPEVAEEADEEPPAWVGGRR